MLQQDDAARPHTPSLPAMKREASCFDYCSFNGDRSNPTSNGCRPREPTCCIELHKAMVAQLRSRGDCCHKFWLVTKMVKRWTPAATANLRNKIARGEINPNIQDAYLGDIVSGEHYPEYKSAPPGGCQTTITRFQRLFRRIQLEWELEGGC